VVDTFDIGYTDEYGLKELVDKAKDRLMDMDLMREKRLILRLLEEIRKNEGSLATYGEDQVRAAIKIGAVEVLLLSEGIRKRRITVECPSCGTVSEMSVTEVPNVVQCPKCNANATVTNNVDIVDDLFEQAESMGTKVELISADSEEGDMLLKAFGGIAALLRYSTG
jgi:peptide chain release factor subunit 1